MKPYVNLARLPFRNRRLFWLAVLGIFAGASWFGLEAIEKKVALDRQVLAKDEELRKVKLQVGKAAKPLTDPLTGKPMASKAVSISPEQNKELLAASDLLERRAFSWSQLLNDIEHHIPRNVRVLRIAVNKVKANEPAAGAAATGEEDRTITLTMEVIGKDTLDVTKMIREFENTGTFTMNPRERKILDGTTDVQFTLDVEYRPPAVRGFRPNPTQLAEKR